MFFKTVDGIMVKKDYGSVKTKFCGACLTVIAFLAGITEMFVLNYRNTRLGQIKIS